MPCKYIIVLLSMQTCSKNHWSWLRGHHTSCKFPPRKYVWFQTRHSRIRIWAIIFLSSWGKSWMFERRSIMESNRASNSVSRKLGNLFISRRVNSIIFNKSTLIQTFRARDCLYCIEAACTLSYLDWPRFRFQYAHFRLKYAHASTVSNSAGTYAAYLSKMKEPQLFACEREEHCRDLQAAP